ncbi:unnamed protein product [Calypogeia fissa]
MARYARLKELGFDTDDSELFEVGDVGMDFLDKLADGDEETGHSDEAERAHQRKSIRDHIYTVPSTELTTEIFSKLQNSKAYGDSRLAQQQQHHKAQQEKQNLENGNPNVCAPDPTTQPTVVAICSHTSTTTTAASSLHEQQQIQGGGRSGASPSGRWVGRNIEERSGRWRTVACESYHRDNSAIVVDNGNSKSSVPAPPPLSRPTCGGQWTPSIYRGTSYRDREPALDHPSHEQYHQSQHSQPQEKQSFSAPHSSCIDGRHCQQRYTKESSPRDGQFRSKESSPRDGGHQFNAVAPIPGPEKRSLPSVMQQQQPRSDASYGGSFVQERGPSFQRSSSAREVPGLQRSSSTRDTPGQRSEMSIDNWTDHPASKSVTDRTKHRVSFSLTENHEVETQRLREKFREPIVPCKKVLQAKQQATNQQALRYNYEQPGFVEHEKENICAGRAYTIYGVKESKDCPKGSSGRHHQVVRAFSLRENSSTYTKMPRAYSVNATGRHIMPMECETCGKGGIGIVFLGLPGDDGSFCKACKSSSGSGWSCGESKPPKKKKSVMDYCRKILRLSQKSR